MFLAKIVFAESLFVWERQLRAYFDLCQDLMSDMDVATFQGQLMGNVQVCNSNSTFRFDLGVRVAGCVSVRLVVELFWLGNWYELDCCCLLSV